MPDTKKSAVTCETCSMTPANDGFGIGIFLVSLPNHCYTDAGLDLHKRMPRSVAFSTDSGQQFSDRDKSKKPLSEA